MKKSALYIICFSLVLLLFSCPQPGEDIDTYSLTSIRDNPLPFLYLDIPNKEIHNTSIKMEYSLDGGTTWSSCSGAIQELPDLSVGNNLVVRSITDSSWSVDLGTVLSMSGRPDLHAGSQIYIGKRDVEKNTWDDRNFYTSGELFDCEFYFYNLGLSTQNTTIKMYLSEDRIIDPGTDTEVMNFDYSYNIPQGEVGGWITELQIPDSIAPGTYFLGLSLDTESNMNELNEENNVTAPAYVVPIYISDDTNTEDGAIKLVNSWGDYDSGAEYNWENIHDGHYWMPYSVLKANEMPVFFYQKSPTADYTPTLRAVFELDHPYRNEVAISVGVGNPADPIVEKVFEPRIVTSLLGGAEPFPDNKIVLDISELAFAINDENLYIKIENTGSTEGTLESFSVELYNSSATPFRTLESSTVSSFTGGMTSFEIPTMNQLTSSELDTITLSPDSPVTSFNFFTSDLSASQIQKDLEAFGNVSGSSELYKGRYRTGYIPPTAEELASMSRITGFSNTAGRAAYGGETLPNLVDLSKKDSFPPIGDQGLKGSCTAFSLIYYIQTYTEAEKRGWDLSSVIWDRTNTTYSASGQPSAKLDNFFSPDFVYNQINGGTDEGSSAFWGIRILQEQGCSTYATQPYRSPPSQEDNTKDYYTTWPTEDAWREASQYRAVADRDYYFNGFSACYFIIKDDSDIQMLKTLLAKGYMLSTSIPAYTVFDALNAQDVVTSGTSWSASQIDHAQTIVGYKEGSGTWDPQNPDA